MFSTEHKDAMAAGHYILAGDFFEDGNGKYIEFLALLAERYNFEGYRNMVLSRRQFSTDSCGIPQVKIFPELRNGVNV